MVEESPGGVAGQIAGLVDEDVFLGLLQHGDFPGDFLLVKARRVKEDDVVPVQRRARLGKKLIKPLVFKTAVVS